MKAKTFDRKFDSGEKIVDQATAVASSEQGDRIGIGEEYAAVGAGITRPTIALP
jgi:hypothetical protein